MFTLLCAAQWTLAKNMTTYCQRPGTKPGTFAANTPGNGHGVQLSTGRLVVPMYGGQTGLGVAGASMCYSDDHGKTWQASPYSTGTGANADEIEIAELNSGKAAYGGGGVKLYMTIRNDGGPAEGTGDGHRMFSTSSDVGAPSYNAYAVSRNSASDLSSRTEFRGSLRWA